MASKLYEAHRHSDLWWIDFSFMQINSVKFNEFAAAIISGGYDRSVRAWDCRSHSMEPIQVQPSKLCIINCNYVGSLLHPPPEYPNLHV